MTSDPAPPLSEGVSFRAGARQRRFGSPHVRASLTNGHNTKASAPCIRMYPSVYIGRGGVICDFKTKIRSNYV